MVFRLDGQIAGQYVPPPAAQSQTTYTYNVLVYMNASLGPGPHVFELQNGYVGGPGSLVLLDYMVYA